jgi:putative NADH-flavin reductase
MKITIIGATGFVGSALLSEALSRGHEVTAIVRDGSRVPAGPAVREIDASDAAALEPALQAQDVVISSFNGGWGDPDIYAKHSKGSAAIAAAAANAGTRLIVVGGAGSLYAPDGSQFVDSDAFPKEWKDGARAARDHLAELKKSTGLDWTFVSPPFELAPGERKGTYRVAGDTPVFDENGKSAISVADLAVAILDEAEKPAHRRARFTVGY